MIDYEYEHDSHVVDWRMFTWMRKTRRVQATPPTDEQIDYERNWLNFQSQLYYGWIKRT